MERAPQSGVTSLLKSGIPCDIIQHNLLNALNTIFGDDGQFSEIQVKLHDEATSENLKDTGRSSLEKKKD